MKKLLFIAAVSATVLASCAKNEVNTVEGGQIAFNTVVGKVSTKALLTGTTYKTTDPSFGTFAFLLQSGQTWAANMASASLYINNNEVTASGPDAQKKWTTAIPYYWPKSGSLTFFSYSPYAALNNVVTCTNNDKGIQITAWDVDANQGVDVMFADKVTEQTANGTNGGYTGVPTVFRHKLSQVAGFTFKTAANYAGTGSNAGDKKFIVKGININGILYTGEYRDAAWVATAGSTKNYTWYQDNTTGIEFGATATTVAENGTGADGYLLVIPQTLPDDAKIVLVYDIQTHNGTAWVTETVTQEVAIKDITASWAENKKITFNFTVSLENDRIYWAPSIVDWTADSPTHTFE